MLIPFDNSFARLGNAFFARCEARKVDAPSLIRVNRELAAELGIDPDRLDSDEGLAILSGNKQAEGSDPLAMVYAGHQFGGFAGQLGDGRALLLGEVVDCHGIRRDIQLKGSGQTPFSRRGDGLSALGPVLREYIVSEAMHALGVPTTRALAAVATNEPVRRETLEPGGVFTRVARSHIRVGTFEWFAANRDNDSLRALADYVIERHYPNTREADNLYVAMLEGVIERQAELIAHWMQLGFIHGVMNTDNTNVSGETIDFGPCAFMDEYHPEKVFSSIDRQGRYAFNNQSPIAQWNLARLAETLLPLINEDTQDAIPLAREALERFPRIHQKALMKRFAAKIGLAEGTQENWDLAQSLLSAMTDGRADFTLTFRRLPNALESGDDSQVTRLFDCPKTVESWLQTWRARLAKEDRTNAIALMRRTNPVFIPRNHRIEEAIQAGYRGDFAPFHRLVEILKRPFDDQPEHADYEAAPKPDQVVRATFCGT